VTLSRGTVRVGTIPLPVGAATSSAQATGNASLASIDTKLTAPLAVTAAGLPLPAGASTSTAQATGNASLASIDTKLTAPLAVTAVALPLPAGASTSSAQATGNASLASIDTKLTSPLGVQIKDAGRVRCIYTFAAVAPAVADTLLTLSQNLGGTVTPGTSFGVTAGKRLRLQAVLFSLRAGAAAAAFGTMNLRCNPTGAVVLASPSILRLNVGTTAAVIGGAVNASESIPDGLEFSGTDQIGVSLAAQAVTNIVSITLIGYEYTP
jgi:hypothetical protein